MMMVIKDNNKNNNKNDENADEVVGKEGGEWRWWWWQWLWRDDLYVEWSGYICSVVLFCFVLLFC